MFLSFSSRTVIGRISGEIRFGRLPLPWVLIPVEVGVALWDMYGNRVTVLVTEKVIIQGKANILTLRSKIYQGVTVMAQGPGVPASKVAADDQTVRGIVTLANIFQINEPETKKD